MEAPSTEPPREARGVDAAAARAVVTVLAGVLAAAGIPVVLALGSGDLAAAPWLPQLGLVAALGGGTTAAAVLQVRRAWMREILTQPTPSPEPPTTAAGARLAWGIHVYETRLGQYLRDQRLARAAAEEAARFEAEFVRQLSHELRTPLNAILGFTRVLLDDLDGPLTADQQEDLSAIQSSGEVLRELVDDVLDLAALQSGQVTLDLAAVDPRPVLSGVASLLRGQLGGKPVAVRLAVADGTPPVLADVRRLRQILVNLGSNAAKFTPRGEVSLEARRGETGFVRFTVSDTGPGIPDDELRTLFDEFVQASTARHRDGSGLGLSIVQRLAELQGGRVSVESKLGVGTRFHVVVPSAPETSG